ncbi:hypothetical protein HM1_1351 [Heliomicrobium modesticaldum Ice1]|uniref:Uncharacterized protein n=1 Tax=Heliobacterium modesticaldum (strain ATCC 51547 / Ice1) TaxID=498761 RepID=B0TBT9_HELMI|nr:hypothetical protein HM1_1351 [Heliomicrobium modesticaldum Ice1]
MANQKFRNRILKPLARQVLHAPMLPSFPNRMFALIIAVTVKDCQ